MCGNKYSEAGTKRQWLRGGRAIHGKPENSLDIGCGCAASGNQTSPTRTGRRKEDGAQLPPVPRERAGKSVPGNARKGCRSGEQALVGLVLIKDEQDVLN